MTEQEGSPHTPPGDPASEAAQILSTPTLAAPSLEYASWGSRVAASLIDGFSETLMQLLLTLVFGFLAAGFLSGLTNLLPNLQNSGASTVTEALSSASLVFALVTGLLNKIVIQWYYGGSVGKLAMGLRVKRENGQDAGFALLVGRYFGYFLSAIPFGMGYVAPLFTAKRQAFHDLVCGTVVIKSRV